MVDEALRKQVAEVLARAEAADGPVGGIE